MEIKWHGDTCFTIKGKKAKVVIDPYKAGDHKLKKINADVVLSGEDYHEKKELVSDVGDARVINWPGEYEVSGSPIVAIRTYTGEKEEGDVNKGKMLIFSFTVDGVRFCHLGKLGVEPQDEVVEAIGDIDVLLVSADGKDCLDVKKIHEVIEEIDPRVIIPMNYKESAAEFLKEMSVSAEKEAVESFEVKERSELPEERTDVVILSSVE